MMVNSGIVLKHIRTLIERNVRAGDTIIGLLRYGAHLPHIYQATAETPVAIHLLLSHMVGFMPPEFFQRGRFILLDDTIYRGVQMQAMKRYLIERCHVREKDILTLAPIVHAESEFMPDDHMEVYGNVEYIAWKEQLAMIVRNSYRPTQRDHPLYYFRSDTLHLGVLLDVLRSIGLIHPVGPHVPEGVFRASVTLSSDVLADVAATPGVTLDEICKVRFYCSSENGRMSLVAAPIVLPTVDLDASAELEQLLESVLGLPAGFYAALEQRNAVDHSGEMPYFFISRGIAAVLLLRVMQVLASRLDAHGISLQSVDPEEFDGSVKYEFPEEYRTFHANIFGKLAGCIEERSEPQKSFPLTAGWIPVLPKERQPIRYDPIMPDEYALAALVAHHVAPAVFDGRRWLPNYGLKTGVTQRQMIDHFRDPIFVSRALDELLDTGLLRAKDFSYPEAPRRWGRFILPGGEFKAIEVARIAGAYKHRPKKVTNVITEELLDLWGPY